MFNKVKIGFKSFWSSKYSFPVLIASLLGILSSILTLFINSSILPLISTVSFLALFVILILTQIKLAGLKIKKGLEPEHFRLITKNMKEGVIIYTPDFKIISFNPAAEEIFGIKKDEIINQVISPSFTKKERFKPLAQIIFPSLAPRVVQVSDNGWPQVTQISTENGLNLLSIFTRTTDRNQNSTSFIKIIEDQTKEEKLTESKIDFVTNSSQALQPTLKEISETLKKIKESAENNTTPHPDNITKGINLTHEAGEIIKNLTEITKLEEGRYVYDFQKVNLTNLINQVAEKARGIADNYNISLSLSVPDNIQVTADSQKITAVFSTLIDNAIKYNNEGGSVEISVTPQENFAKITVSDTGIGIEEEELDKIFNKFYRTERGAEIIPNASGLGLYIAKKIIEKHGGKIWAESTPERGSAFHFTLPLNS